MTNSINARHNSLVSSLPLREHTVNNIAKVSCCLALYLFCWLGLGTPFIWLKHYDPLNAKIYEIINYGTLLLIFLIFLSVCLLKFRQVLECVGNSKFALLFIGFISLSLVWSPVGLFEKASLGFSLGICITGAFAALVCLGWEKSWGVVMFSLCGIMFPTLVFEFVPYHPPLKVIAITYSGGLISFLILTLWVTSSTKKKNRLVSVITVIGIFIGILMMLFPFIGDVSSAIENSTNAIKPWSPHWRLSSWGLFINPNLYNRGIQVLLIASLITALNHGYYSREPSVRISVIALLIAVISAFVLFDHRASTGRFILIVCSFAFVGLLIIKEFRSKLPWTKSLNRKSVFALVIFTGLIYSVVLLFGIDDRVLVAFEKAIKQHNLASRLRIWQTAIPMLQGQSLLIGEGLGGFWAGDPKLASQDPYLNVQAHAHSGLIDLILQTAVIGSVLFWAAVILKSSRIITDRETGSFVVATTSLLAIVGLLSMNFFESALLPVSSAAMLPFTLVLVFLFRPTNNL